MAFELLTPREVAQLLRLEVVTIYAAAADGRIPCIRLWTGRKRAVVRFRREDIDQLLADKSIRKGD